MDEFAFLPSRRTAMLGMAAATIAGADAAPLSLAKLPRWRGFNLLEKFTLGGDAPYRESDFDFLATHGFNYVRLPLDYRIWTSDSGDIREAPLKEIDAAVAFARARNIHLTLCLHRAPGYCINPPAERLDLWGDDDTARTLFVQQWRMFAQRYRAIAASALSFNLVNEAPSISEEQYLRVAVPAVNAIRAENPDRIIIADGRGAGRDPTPLLAPLNVVQAGRGYEPFHLSHYRAGWVQGSDSWPEPTWPLQAPDGIVDQARLWRDVIEPWKKLEAMGVGVFIGEWGAYNKTPHAAALAWMQACLENWQKCGWGWCLWNLRGDFGPLNSRRSDVHYVEQDGLAIDAAMLDLLQRF